MRMVLAALSIGVGGEEAGAILGMLDLPGSGPFRNHAFQNIEEQIVAHIRDICTEGCEDALEEEVRLTLKEQQREWDALTEEERKNKKKPISFDEWKNTPQGAWPHVDLIVSFNMGWQQRASG